MPPPSSLSSPSSAAASAAPNSARPAASMPPPSSRLARMSLPAAWRPQRWRVEGAEGDRSTSAAATSKGGHLRRPSPMTSGGSISLSLRRGSSSASPLEQRTPLRQSKVSAWANACVGSNSSSSSTLRGAVGGGARAAAAMTPSSFLSFRRRQQQTGPATTTTTTAARASSNAAAAAAGSATSLQASAPGSTTTVSIQFDNGADAEGTGATLLTVEAPGADDLLAEATGVLDALGLRVQSASIHRPGESGSGGGGSRLAFRVTGEGGGQVPEPAWEGVRDALAALWGFGGGGGALSSLPAIYGVAAEAEVKRLRPLSTGQEGDAAALELAAAEMAQAAAQLVAVEREVKAAAELLLAAESGGAGAQRSSASFSMSNPAALRTALDAAEARRAEAAAQLERRMAAMEAVLASRRAAADSATVAVASREPSTALGDVLSILSGPMPSTQLLSPQASPAAAAATPAISPEASPSAAFASAAAGSMLGAAAPGVSSGPAAGSGREIILQGFNWESHRDKWYVKLESQLDEIAEAGFTAVWLPPPSDSVSAQGYLPRDLYKLDSAYGSEAELRSLVRAMHDRGLKAIADIVINHRCAHSQDEQGRWNRFGGRLPWDERAICCNNQRFGGKGAHKTGDDYVAAPNIDHTQESIRNDLIGKRRREERERGVWWVRQGSKKRVEETEKTQKNSIFFKKKTQKKLKKLHRLAQVPAHIYRLRRLALRLRQGVLRRVRADLHRRDGPGHGLWGVLGKKKKRKKRGKENEEK